MGMCRSVLRGLVSCMLVILLPFSLVAADSSAGMLYTNGAAWINGAHVPSPSLAIFSGDLLQTRSDSAVKISEPGSSVTVLGDSLVTFGGASMQIEHGGITVATSKAMAATAGDVKVVPTSNAWTEFSVTDVDGIVRIAANKGDLSIFDGQNTATLPQGQETTRDESNKSKDGKKKNNKAVTGAVPAAGGGAMNSPIVVGAGAGAIGAVTIWVLTKGSQPASPSAP